MEKQVYITEEEREKCRKVAKTFAELEDVDVVTVDVGRYGFVVLKYYHHPNGFDFDESFHDSSALFEYLWNEWLTVQILAITENTPLDVYDFAERWDKLQEEQREELMQRKTDFARVAEMKL